MAESLALLLRDEVETVWRCALGMVPCQRWQALLGRSNPIFSETGLDSPVQDGFGTLRSFVCLGQFREKGVQLSDEWRRRRRSGRLRLTGPGEIELTTAERAATPGRIPTVTQDDAAWSSAVNPGSHTFGLGSDWHRGDGALPGLAASLAAVSDVDEHDGPKPFLQSRGNGASPGEQDGTASPMGGVLEDTDEDLSFFLEVEVSTSMRVKHTLVVASQPTPVGACPSPRPSPRPIVDETYDIKPSSLRAAFPDCSLEAALLPADPISNVDGDGQASLLEKRSSSRLYASDGAGWDETLGHSATLSHNYLAPDGPPLAKRLAMTALSGAHCVASVPETFGSRQDPATSLEAIYAHETAQLAKGLVPFARLQHALAKVGAGISLDLDSLTQLPSPFCPVSSCAVLLGGEEGWSSAQLAANFAVVRFLPGHSQADSWEWKVTLGSTTQLMDYVPVDTKKSGEHGVVLEHLSLLENVEIGRSPPVRGAAGEIRNSSHIQDQKFIRFRFPASFSVHAMCRAFALAGEGLTAMWHLTSQAAKLLRTDAGGGGYSVVSFSPIHVALRDFSSRHMVLLTHSAFSATCIGCAERPGLVLIPQPEVPTCPAALRELEASVKKHLDLSALLHGLSRTLPVLEVVARVVPGVGRGIDTPGGGNGNFLLSAVSPACFVLSKLSAHGAQRDSYPSRDLTLMVQAQGRVGVSRQGEGKEDVTVDALGLRDLLLEWIASNTALP